MPDWLSLAIDSFWPMLYAGLTFTIPLTLLTFVLGLILGFVVALIRLYGPAPLKSAVRFYVWIIRGTPLLVQLFLIFYAHARSQGLILVTNNTREFERIPGIRLSDWTIQ